MAEPTDNAGEKGFLRRWSQRKLASARETQAPPPAPAAPSAAPLAPSTASALPVAAPMPAQQPDEAPPAPALPKVEGLTFDSDFGAFLGPEVEEGTRRAALRKLFSDPRFNVQDGLDVYIDDYNKFVPMTPEIVKQLRHARYLFDPPKTRINAQGWVEDVPPDETAAPGAAAEAEAEAAEVDVEADAATTTATATGEAVETAGEDKPLDQASAVAAGQPPAAAPDAGGQGEGTEPGRTASELAPDLPPTVTLPGDPPARQPLLRPSR